MVGGATGEVVLLRGGQGNGDNGRLLHQYRRGMPLPQLRLLFLGFPDLPLVACSIPTDSERVLCVGTQTFQGRKLWL